MKRFIAVLAVLAGLWAVCDLTAATVDTTAGVVDGKLNWSGDGMGFYITQNAVVGRKVKAVIINGAASTNYYVRNGSATGTTLVRAWSGSTTSTLAIPTDFTLPLKTWVGTDSAASSATIQLHLGNW